MPGLLVGSFIPDLEVPLMWILFPSLPDHLVLHSLIGVLTLGTLAAVILTRFFYAPVVSRVFRVDRNRLETACRVTPTIVLSCLLGALFHLVLDIPMHPYNPVLWPWVSPFDVVGVLVVFFAEGGNMTLAFVRANLLVSIVMTIAGCLIVVHNLKGSLWNRLWQGED